MTLTPCEIVLTVIAGIGVGTACGLSLLFLGFLIGRIIYFL